ncbi:MAG: polyprenyl synthetase family protein [Clostridia bacterium]|nr:polyprenyl synthetase family protein [Clostridia bacterium]
MRYSLLLGGKRIRPALLLEFYKISGGKNDGALPFALAIELIHTYSLIHDDLPCMDNDDMRRGKPSNHKVFGEDIALLAGDGLLTLAFEVASKTKNISPERVVRAIGELSHFAGMNGMVGGQVIDLQSEGKKVDIKVIEELNLLKTGGLLRAAAKVGTILAGGDEKLIYAADRYGEATGLAFQIVDDILDITADSNILGKPVGSDEKNGKSTFVSHYGIERCRQIVDSLTESAINSLNEFDGDTTFLKELTLYLARREH